MVNTSGSLVNEYDYDIFGNITKSVEGKATQVFTEGAIGGLTFGISNIMTSAITNSSTRNIMINATKDMEKAVATTTANKGASAVKGIASSENSAGAGKVGNAVEKKPIIMGENMKRVQQYADEVGGHAYKPW